MVSLDISIQSKVYSGSLERVLERLGFSVAKGEFVALVGPSGAGKSTLLNMIAGLEKSALGEVLYNGSSMADRPPCKIGYIFQQPRLMPWLSVADNLRLVMPKVSDTQIEAILGRVGLSGKSASYSKQLSGGMQRRVSIARAFLTQPELLLLDEPFVSLDAPNAQRLRALLLELWQEHKPTVVFVTHDLDEAIQLADRVLFLSSAPGRVVRDKVVDIQRPRFTEDSAFQQWKKQMLREHSGLLEGDSQ